MTKTVLTTGTCARSMGGHGMFATTDLVPLLADRDVMMNAGQVDRVVTGRPGRMSMQLLAALWDILGCTPNNLIEPYVATSSRRGRKTGTPTPASRNRRRCAHHPRRRRVLSTQGRIDLSHDALDTRPQVFSVTHLRSMLVAAGALPPYENAVRLHRYATEAVADNADPDLRGALGRFARCHVVVRATACLILLYTHHHSRQSEHRAAAHGRHHPARGVRRSRRRPHHHRDPLGRTARQWSSWAALPR